MFTGIFRVKGGGRFSATTFCFLLFSLPLPFLRLQLRQQIGTVHEHAKREKKEVLEKNYFFTRSFFCRYSFSSRRKLLLDLGTL